MLSSGEIRPPAVHVDEVDGVPLVWGEVEGPLSASLLFRVGRSDETLVSGGITHLVEHLALYREGAAMADPHFNGQVDSLSTVFYTHGRDDEVTSFLARVSEHLQALPYERLSVEREILRSEATGRNLGNGWSSLMRWTYGPRTYGLEGYEEFGLHRLERDEVEAWRLGYFTRGNAVLMLSGPPPAGLTLPLPEGLRRPPVAPSSALPETPAWYHEGEPGGCLLTALERTTVGPVLRHVIEHRLRARLRYDMGASYSPGVAYQPRDHTHAHLFIGADAVPEQADAVRREVATVLQELGEDDVAASDLDGYRRTARDTMFEPGARKGWIYTRAMDILLEREELSFDAWLDELVSLEPTQVVAAARGAQAASLLRLGGEFEGVVQDRALAPIWSEGPRLEGRTYEEIRAEPDVATNHLVVTSRAASAELVDGGRVQVEFDAVDAALLYPDGLVTLVASDGFTLAVDPRHWVEGTEAARSLTSSVPAAKRIRMPEREVPPVATFPHPRKQRFLEVGLGLGLAVVLLGLVAILADGFAAGAVAAAVVVAVASIRESGKRYRALLRVRGYE